MRGNRLDVAAERIEPGPAATTRLIPELDYVTADGKGASIEVLLNPRPGQSDRRSVRLLGCAAGCRVAGPAIARTLAGGGGNVFEIDVTSYRVLLTQLSVGDRSLLDVAWQPDRSAIDGPGNIRFYPGLDLYYRSVANRLDGLEVNPLPDGLLDLQVAAISDPIPEFAAGAEPGVPLDIAGNDRVLGEGTRFEALPLLGGIGQLTDLPTSMVGSRPTVPDAETSIVVAEDTPASMLTALTDATGTKARSLEDVRRTLAAAAGADQSRAYALMAAFCALVALLALAAGVARHLRSYRHDVASLRVLGVGLGEARRAGRLELGSPAVVVVLAVAVGGYLAARLLLDGLPLVNESPAAVPLDAAPDLLTLAVPAVLASLAMLLVGGRARAVRPSATRPSTLREEEGR
ncbi:hypothetical protein [Nocardioides sp. B-3]|uniref:hypothetical protein n=1 Tax=Nocardioides sp. B-3 TaxID=2895565 RepID=UPI002152089A|nr:hypothetical protein [Nocardioides sp. B-3]UUZ61200.1 hypothetical protein LP418_11640 [Nocardioides sp. B-3]